MANVQCDRVICCNCLTEQWIEIKGIDTCCTCGKEGTVADVYAHQEDGAGNRCVYKIPGLIKKHSRFPKS